MAPPPRCRSLGRHCQALDVTLRVASLRDDSPTLQDALGTWLLAHTERIAMGTPYVADDEVLVAATIAVPCRYLASAGAYQRFSCAIHGFRGPLPEPNSTNGRAPLVDSDGETIVYYQGRTQALRLPLRRAAQRMLPVRNDGNPCVGAPCRTGDNRRGAACCRDLTIDVLLPASDEHLESLLRTRQAPYLCKVTRTDLCTVECEVISACGYLEDDGISCALHDRVLPNGRLAKPSVCTEWPDEEPDGAPHPGCIWSR